MRVAGTAIAEKDIHGASAGVSGASCPTVNVGSDEAGDSAIANAGKGGATRLPLGMPGAIAPMSLKDAVTGRELTVTVGTMFTVLTVDGRDYYFDRFTGRFAGTGSSV